MILAFFKAIPGILFGTRMGRYALIIAGALGAFWWFVDDVADKREAVAIEKTTKKIETGITKQNKRAETNADDGEKDVRDCYGRGKRWSVRLGKCVSPAGRREDSLPKAD